MTNTSIRLLISIAFVSCIALVFYLSWNKTPRLSFFWFVPRDIAAWGDKDGNGNIRTAIPFVFLGSLAAIWLAVAKCHYSQWFKVLLCLTLIALTAECGQLFYANRFFDVFDILWAFVGSALGMAMIFLLRIIMVAKRQNMPRQKTSKV